MTCIVEAWDKFQEEICAKAWTVCGYNTKNEFYGDSNTGLVPYSNEQVGELLRRLCGDDTYVNFQDEAEIGTNLMFPKDGEYCEE